MKRPTPPKLIAVIDIGSNSVRLVVYLAALRAAPILFNEKVMCGLGAGIDQTGAMRDEAIESAVQALRRFAMLCEDMGVSRIEAVATAAVRKASNAKAFLARVRAEAGLKVQVLSGEQEARFSALGVLSAIPGADGLVGDLGGGSMELVQVQDGQVIQGASLPMGVLTVEGMSASRLREDLFRQFESLEWLRKLRGKPILAVGGSWRALAHLDMHLTAYPLQILHEYRMDSGRPYELARVAAIQDRSDLKKIENLTERRIPALPAAGAMLGALAEFLDASGIVISAYGLREGILFERLPRSVREQDPLLSACRYEAAAQSRFPDHCDVLMAWLDDLFQPSESAADNRLRQAACLLSDVAWRGHPDFRAERALDASLYGNWVGVDGRGRMMIGLALFACYGGGMTDVLKRMAHALLNDDEFALAQRWGLALRLGQRLTGGTANALKDSRLISHAGELRLLLTRESAGMQGEVVERRLKALANAFGLEPALIVSPN